MAVAQSSAYCDLLERLVEIGRERRTYGEGESRFDGFGEFLWMPHIPVDVGKDGVASPW